MNKSLFSNTGGVMSTVSGAHLLILPNDITLSPALAASTKKTLAGSPVAVNVVLSRVSARRAVGVPTRAW